MLKIQGEIIGCEIVGQNAGGELGGRQTVGIRVQPSGDAVYANKITSNAPRVHEMTPYFAFRQQKPLKMVALDTGQEPLMLLLVVPCNMYLTIANGRITIHAM